MLEKKLLTACKECIITGGWLKQNLLILCLTVFMNLLKNCSKILKNCR
jgi:hypothetical protein